MTNPAIETVRDLPVLESDYLQTIEHLEAQLAEKDAEIYEQCRLNGMGAEREARLLARIAEKDSEIERLRKCHEAELGVCYKHCDEVIAKDALIAKCEEALKSCNVLAKSWIAYSVMGSKTFICGTAIQDRTTLALSAIRAMKGEQK